MKKELLEILKSPKTRTELQLKNEIFEGGEIKSGILYDSKGNEYNIVDYIPRFVKENPGNTIESFSYKWKTFVEPALQKQEKNKEIFLEHYGFKSADEFKKFLSTRKKVLDAGCGPGYISNWIHSESIAQVFGIDISTSVDEARKHFCLKGIENLNYIQADISELPFDNEFFDYIVCKEVIHHTLQPRENFSKLVNLLSYGGVIQIYVYKKKGPIREFCDSFLRDRTTKLTVEECHEFAKTMTAVGKSLRETKVNITIPKDIPFLNIKAGIYDLQRFIYWNVFKCWWDDEGDYDYSNAVNFDWYHPLHAFRYDEEEIKKWFNDENVRIDNLNILDAGIAIRGTRIR